MTKVLPQARLCKDNCKKKHAHHITAGKDDSFETVNDAHRLWGNKTQTCSNAYRHTWYHGRDTTTQEFRDDMIEFVRQIVEMVKCEPCWQLGIEEIKNKHKNKDYWLEEFRQDMDQVHKNSRNTKCLIGIYNRPKNDNRSE